KIWPRASSAAWIWTTPLLDSAVRDDYAEHGYHFSRRINGGGGTRGGGAAAGGLRAPRDAAAHGRAGRAAGATHLRRGAGTARSPAPRAAAPGPGDGLPDAGAAGGVRPGRGVPAAEQRDALYLLLGAPPPPPRLYAVRPRRRGPRLHAASRRARIGAAQSLR